MIHPWVKLSLYQYEQLKKLKEKTGKPVSEIIREAASRFIRKKDYPVSIAASYLPRATGDNYKSVTAYFPQSDWNLVEKISKNTGRCKSDLIREAMEEHLKEYL